MLLQGWPELPHAKLRVDGTKDTLQMLQSLHLQSVHVQKPIVGKWRSCLPMRLASGLPGFRGGLMYPNTPKEAKIKPKCWT